MSVLLVDFDSLLYTSVYKIVGISAMRDALEKYGREGAEQWLNEEVYNEGINRCENELLKIQNYVDQLMLDDISGIELFITTCSNNFRNKIYPDHKANRKRNKYVWLLRSHYQMNGATYSDELEADDLIAIRAKELGYDNCVIISIDKDLRQIPGMHWSYYKVKSKDHYGNPILNEFGIEEKEYRQKSIDFVSKEDAENCLWKQVLTGDSGDNIKGLHRVGEKTADKILKDAPVKWVKVAREYIKRGQKEDFKINYNLIKLGNHGIRG